MRRMGPSQEVCRGSQSLAPCTAVRRLAYALHTTPVSSPDDICEEVIGTCIHWRVHMLPRLAPRAAAPATASPGATSALSTGAAAPTPRVPGAHIVPAARAASPPPVGTSQPISPAPAVAMAMATPVAIKNWAYPTAVMEFVGCPAQMAQTIALAGRPDVLRRAKLLVWTWGSDNLLLFRNVGTLAVLVRVSLCLLPLHLPLPPACFG